MTYKVFSPFMGQYISYETLEDAKHARVLLIEDYLRSVNLFQNVFFNNPSPEDKAVANEFVAIKLGISEVNYLYTVFNATTNSILSRVFSCTDSGKDYLIKVQGGQVTEWYEANVEFNGGQKLYVALDVSSDKVIEYYENDNGVVTKYDTTGAPMAITIWGGYDLIPDNKRALLTAFAYKDAIQAHSDKSYGFCVEYRESKTVPYDSCTQEEKNRLDLGKQNFIQTTDLFPVSQEITHENGDVTWVTIDTTTW